MHTIAMKTTLRGRLYLPMALKQAAQFHTSVVRPATPFLHLAARAHQQETQHFMKQSRLSVVNHSPSLELLKSSEVDPFKKVVANQTGPGKALVSSPENKDVRLAKINGETINVPRFSSGEASHGVRPSSINSDTLSGRLNAGSGDAPAAGALNSKLTRPIPIVENGHRNEQPPYVPRTLLDDGDDFPLPSDLEALKFGGGYTTVRADRFVRLVNSLQEAKAESKVLRKELRQLQEEEEDRVAARIRAVKRERALEGDTTLPFLLIALVSILVVFEVRAAYQSKTKFSEDANRSSPPSPSTESSSNSWVLSPTYPTHEGPPSTTSFASALPSERLSQPIRSSVSTTQVNQLAKEHKNSSMQATLSSWLWKQ